MRSIDVKLTAFEGPLDLLLFLIEKNKVNIYDIPIITITEQYIEYINRMEESDMDVMSEFLVMAATLIRIKAKMLLPAGKQEDGDEEDLREDLVRRLLEYKMYKYAAYELRDMQVDAERAFYKKPTIPEEIRQYKEEIDPAELVDGMTLAKLNEIFKSVMRRQIDKVDPIRSKFGRIEKEEVTIEEKMDEIRETVKGLRGISFRTLLDMQADRMNIIVTFLSVLELMKIGAVLVRQEEIFGDIVIDSMEQT